MFEPKIIDIPILPTVSIIIETSWGEEIIRLGLAFLIIAWIL